MDVDDEDAYLYGDDETVESKPVVPQTAEQTKTGELKGSAWRPGGHVAHVLDPLSS